jgi:hypothetical protein
MRFVSGAGDRGAVVLRIGGISLAIEDPASALLPSLSRLYAHAELDVEPKATDLRVEVQSPVRRPTEPPDEPLIAMMLDRLLRGWLMHGGLWLSDGRNAAWVDYGLGEARIDVAERDEAALYVTTHHAFPIAVGELHRTRGRYALHAAALKRPDGRGILLLGDSDCGKSTLSYRALTLGFRCIADDGVVLHASGEGDPGEAGVVVSPFYRELCLHPDRLREEDRDRAVEIEPALSGKRYRVELPEASLGEEARVDVVWILRRTKGERSALEPASRAELLAELVRQNRRVLLHQDLAAAHLELLSNLTASARGYVARLGSGILTDDLALEELFSA